MIKYKIIKIDKTETESVVCDICSSEYMECTDFMEVQEFVHIDFLGGYGSVFGDGAEVMLDICQHCLKSILGNYINRRMELNGGNNV